MKSRDRIITAAIQAFARKGRHGAHMEEIASLAHINKAMIYYIFHNKDELYLEVLKYVLNDIASSVYSIPYDDMTDQEDFEKILSEFISSQIEFFSNNHHYTKIMVDSMSNGKQEVQVAIKYFKSNHENKSPINGLKQLLETARAKKYIRDLDIDHLMINIIGMINIYFHSHSITEAMDIEIKDEKHFLENRRKSIIDLLLSSILIAPRTCTKQKK